MTTDISTVRSDGSIPNSQAQSWCTQSLADFDQACSAITSAAEAEQVDLQNGVTGYDPSVMTPGSQAAADLEAAVQLLERVGNTITLKQWHRRRSTMGQEQGLRIQRSALLGGKLALARVACPPKALSGHVLGCRADDESLLKGVGMVTEREMWATPIVTGRAARPRSRCSTR